MWGKNKKYFKPPRQESTKNIQKTSKNPPKIFQKIEALEYDFPSFYPFF